MNNLRLVLIDKDDKMVGYTQLNVNKNIKFPD
jgi:hypothetical protein